MERPEISTVEEFEKLVAEAEKDEAKAGQKKSAGAKGPNGSGDDANLASAVRRWQKRRQEEAATKKKVAATEGSVEAETDFEALIHDLAEAGLDPERTQAIARQPDLLDALLEDLAMAGLETTAPKGIAKPKTRKPAKPKVTVGEVTAASEELGDLMDDLLTHSSAEAAKPKPKRRPQPPRKTKKPTAAPTVNVETAEKVLGEVFDEILSDLAGAGSSESSSDAEKPRQPAPPKRKGSRKPEVDGLVRKTNKKQPIAEDKTIVFSGVLHLPAGLNICCNKQTD